jgi:hypothetical protein
VDKLEASSRWAKTKEDQDVIVLLQLIQGITHQHDKVKQGTMSYVDQLVKWILNFQKDGQDLSEWLKTFKAGAEIIDTYGGLAGFHPKVVDQHRIKLAKKLGKLVDELTDEEAKEALESACEEFKACALIRLANNKVFGDLKKDLDNMHLFGHSAYATTVDGAYRQLQNYQVMHGGQKPGARPSDRDKNTDGLAFFQGGSKPCHSCGKPHLLKDCPDLTEEEKKTIYQAVKAGTHKKGQTGQNHTNVGTEASEQECLEGVANISVNLSNSSIVSADGAEDGDIFVDGIGLLLPTDHWTNSKKVDCGRNKIFLDSCATNHTMFAMEHLTGCHTTKTFLRQNCNAGSKLVNRMGTWRGIKFWINEVGIANLLSIPQLEKSGCKIQYNTGGKWLVLTPNNRVVTFEHDVGVCGGMPFIDVTRDPSTYIRDMSPDDGFNFVQTVRENMEGFTAEQVRRATEARNAMAMMAHPPMAKMEHLVSSTNVVANVPFTKSDLTNSVAIFGKDRGAVRGKTVRQKPSRVRHL